MELDQKRYPAVVTSTLPSIYARHALPGHEKLVQTGDFGQLIQQAMNKTGHVVCVGYFTLEQEVELYLKPATSCSFLYYIWEATTPVTFFTSRLGRTAINEDGCHYFQFSKGVYKVKFKKGKYRSIYITVDKKHRLYPKISELNSLFDQYIADMSPFLAK